MKECIKCHLNGDDESFYPSNKVCKLCINKIRKSRIQEAIDEADKAEREQAPIRNVIKQFQENGEPYVYLIEASNRFKIGYSKNIDTRVRAFNTANSVPCKIIAVAPGGAQLEKELHKKFEFQRINREWFKPSQIILNEFKKLPNVMIFLKGYMKKERFTPSCRMDGSF